MGDELESIDTFNRILIAVDGSDEARHAVRCGLELAEVFDAAVDGRHVVPQQSLRLTRSADERTRLRERGAAAPAEIEALASALDRAVVSTRPCCFDHLSEGKPATQITEHAATQNADFVVIGRQGMTGLCKRLLGGVTERVLHRNDVPVFLVPSTEQDPENPTEYARILVPTDGSNSTEVARHTAQ